MAYENFQTETDSDGIMLVTWDMPGRSMNVFTEAVMDELESIIDAVAGDEAVKGVVFTSGKKGTFSGGADITMINAMYERFQGEAARDPEGSVKTLFDMAGRMSWLFRKLETCGKPWVSAINGTCMGGATELSLACHARVMAQSDKPVMALPEVKIGIFPGAGGTQRVPRLADTQASLEMMTTGKSLLPAKAKAMGLVHEVVPADELVETAKQMLRERKVDPVAPWDKKGFRGPGQPVYSAAGAQLWPAASAILRRETQMNYPGAAAILKCVYEGLQVPFDTALTIEQRYFTEVLRTPEARNMIRSLFISMQELNKGARRPEGVGETNLQTIGVVGAGFMGAGIAYVSAKAGLNVVLVDRDQAAADKGRSYSEGLNTKAVQKRRMKQEDADALLSRITATDDYSKLSDCDLIVEAVFEDRDVKREVTQKIDAQTSADCVYASNTSTLPITGLAEYSKNAENFIGIHFFSPVDKMMLVEVIMGEKTGERALATALDFVRRIKKTPIVVNDTRGFYINRCVLKYMTEAYDMLVEGVPPAMIENAARQAGMPVGPLALNDETAIDLSQKIMRATQKDLGEQFVKSEHMSLVDRMVEQGRLGRKAGKGFYDYPDRPAKKHLWPGLREMHEQKAAHEVDFEELKQRFLVVMALEAARTFEEGVVTDVREADVGSILGFGFAPYTGGMLSYIDMMGAADFVALADRLKAKYGDQFEAPQLLRDMAANGQTFYERFDPYAQAA